MHYRDKDGSVKALVVNALNRKLGLNHALNWCAHHNVQFLALWPRVIPVNHTQEIEPF